MDRTGKPDPLSIELVPGDVAPRYAARSVRLRKMVVTEKGMQSGLPIVDLILEDQDGTQLVVVTTGRIVQMMGRTIDAVNERNHGKKDP